MNMSYITKLSLLLSLAIASNKASTVWINEWHRPDEVSQTEFVEVAGVAGTDLNDYSIMLYHETKGSLFDVISFDDVQIIPDQFNAFGAVSIDLSSVSHDSPDGIVLLHHGLKDIVVQFVSYEHSFRAHDGPAVNMDSVTISNLEHQQQQQSGSAQLCGTGSHLQHFHFLTLNKLSPGQLNDCQTFITSLSNRHLLSVGPAEVSNTSTSAPEPTEYETTEGLETTVGATIGNSATSATESTLGSTETTGSTSTTGTSTTDMPTSARPTINPTDDPTPQPTPMPLDDSEMDATTARPTQATQGVNNTPTTSAPHDQQTTSAVPTQATQAGNAVLGDFSDNNAQSGGEEEDTISTTSVGEDLEELVKHGDVSGISRKSYLNWLVVVTGYLFWNRLFAVNLF